MTEILVSRRAQADLKRIWHFIAEDSPDAADRLLLRIDEKISLLADFPEIGPPRPDIRAATRILIAGRYLVLYEYDQPADVVEIVAVVEAMRDLKALF